MSLFSDFSSLISAVDPVAVLAIFDEIGVNKNLYFLVFGESLFNDGVTVVLYNTMVTLSHSDNVGVAEYGMAFLSFFFVVFGGLLIGIICGAFSAYFTKFTQHTRVVEPLVIWTSAYFSFIFADPIVELSSDRICLEYVLSSFGSMIFMNFTTQKNLQMGWNHFCK